MKTKTTWLTLYIIKPTLPLVGSTWRYLLFLEFNEVHMINNNSVCTANFAGR